MMCNRLKMLGIERLMLDLRLPILQQWRPDPRWVAWGQSKGEFLRAGAEQEGVCVREGVGARAAVATQQQNEGVEE